MYDVTITNCTTLVISRTHLRNPLDVIGLYEWVELQAQHQVDEQIDLRLTTKSGDVIHVKAREMT